MRGATGSPGLSGLPFAYLPIPKWSARSDFSRDTSAVPFSLSDVTSTAPLPLLQQVLSHVNDVVLITEAEPLDRPGPRIIFVNEAFERMSGYTAEEVYGRTPRLLQGPRTDPTVLATLRAALNAWQSCRVQVTNYRKNGIPFDVEFDVTPIADSTGWFTHWVSIQRDITHATVAGRVIQQAVTLDELGEGICRELREYAGADGVAWCTRVSGQLQWHVMHHGDIDVVNPDELVPAEQLIVAPLATTGGLEVRIVLERAEDPFTEFERTLVQAVAVRAAPACERIHAMQLRDRMETVLRQSEKLEAIGRLAGGVAHDFNNLLMIMLGNVEYLQSIVAATSETKPVFAEIMRASGRARDLVQHLLAFGRQRRLVLEPFSVDAVIKAATQLLERSTADVIDLTTAVETPAPVVVGDPSMVEQVLVNVVMNARDAIAALPDAHRGEVRIVAARVFIRGPMPDRTGVDLPAGRYVAIDIIDDGPGMSDEVRQRAFDPFFTTKPIGAGSGLGLSSAYGAVTMMGGTVEIDPVEPSGTRVRVLLPSA